jgi:hypothetical protein
MNLENKIGDNKISFFSKFKRKLLPYILATSLGLGITGCWVEFPGPISVKNEITPSIVQSGNNVYWTIEVTNYGGRVTIDRASVYEQIISGWAEGQSASADLLITDNEIPAHHTKTIFSVYTPVDNIPPYYDTSDITLENTVTVNSDGGSASDTSTYTILSIYNSSKNKLESGKKSLEADKGVVRGLLDYSKE